MLRIEQVTARAGARVLLDRVSLAVHAGEVAAVLGPNGSGKSTLLRIAAGLRPAEGGRVELAPSARMAYLPQQVEAPAGTLARDRFPALFPDQAETLFAAAGERIARATSAAALDAAEAAYAHLLEQVAQGGAALEVARALGLPVLDPDQPAASLSGGELAKAALAELLGAGAGVLLLDEPTNHLDLPATEWLEGYLRAFPGAVLLVSHDRALLDAVAVHLLVLGGDGGAAEVFPGGYSAWAAEEERRREAQREAFRRQEREARRRREAISAIESRSRDIENKTVHFHFRKRALKVARRATTLKARLEREAASASHVERTPEPPRGLRATFGTAEASASRLAEADGVRLEVAGRPLLDGVSFTLERGQRVALTGANGAGKSTLLRAILGEHPVAAGRLSLSGSAHPGHLAQGGVAAFVEPDVTPLLLARRAAGVSEREAYNLLHLIFLGHEQAATPVARLSEGERRRLALGLLTFAGANLLLLDEPTNHLDVAAQESFHATLEGFDGTVVVATHDRALIDRFASAVWRIQDGRLVTT